MENMKKSGNARKKCKKNSIAKTYHYALIFLENWERKGKGGNQGKRKEGELDSFPERKNQGREKEN